MKRFRGQTVLVTGAGSGIGRATAQLFAAEGARAVVLDRDAVGVEACVAEIRAAAGEAEPAVCDVSDATALAAVVERIGTLNILVSNAALFLMKPVTEADAEDWERILRTNVMAGALLARLAAPRLRQAGGGSIVLVSSVNGSKAEAGYATYSTSKAALQMLARCMAIDLGPWNIRVNAVSPGPVDTPALRAQLAREGMSWEEFVRFAQQNQCLQSVVEPEDIARAILFLTSQEARMITGINLTVDGGYTARN